MAKLQVFLMADDTLLREAIKMLINTQTDMTLVGEASNMREALVQTKERQPDILVIDIALSPRNSGVATERIRHVLPQVRVLALARPADEVYLQRLLWIGASGYLNSQQATADELLDAIRVTAAGGTHLFGRSPSTQSPPPPSKLTEPETKVLHMIALGWTHKQIAFQLSVPVKSIEKHRSIAATKLHLSSRADIVSYANAQGWLPT